MRPGQRAAETRRRNRASSRAAFLAEQLPVLKQECIDARAEVLRLARAFAALPMEASQITADAANELSRAGGSVWSRFHWLADCTRELEELRRGAVLTPGNVIELFPRRAP